MQLNFAVARLDDSLLYWIAAHIFTKCLLPDVIFVGTFTLVILYRILLSFMPSRLFLNSLRLLVFFECDLMFNRLHLVIELIKLAVVSMCNLVKG